MDRISTKRFMRKKVKKDFYTGCMKLPFFSLLSCAEIAENAQKIANITDFLLRIIFFGLFQSRFKGRKVFLHSAFLTLRFL